MRQMIVRRGEGGRGKGQVTWETFREKGKITKNRQRGCKYYCAALVLYVFHADRKTFKHLHNIDTLPIQYDSSTVPIKAVVRFLPQGMHFI